MSLNDEQLAEIQGRVDTATEGPWLFSTRKSNYSPAIGHPDGRGGWTAHLDAGDLSNGDAEFIAHSREDVPALLAEVRSLRAQREAVLALSPFRFADADDPERNLGDQVLWRAEVLAALGVTE